MNTKMDHQSMKIGFIGGGNIAQAIATGLLEKGVLIPRNIWVSSRTENTLSRWKMFEVHTTLKNGQVVENCDVIFLAVKPHLLDSMVQDTVNTLTQTATSKLFISVLAGVPLDTLMNKLLCISPNPRIVRSMPNTPMMVGEGIIVYCSKNTTLADQDLVNMLFSCTGITECVPESLINAISGLSGSGPAYVYLMIEAFADGAVKMGVPRDMATKFAAQVMVGAGKMVLHSGKHPGQLKDEVCSPGGTTIVGIHALECGSVRRVDSNCRFCFCGRFLRLVFGEEMTCPCGKIYLIPKAPKIEEVWSEEHVEIDVLDDAADFSPHLCVLS